MPFPEADPLVSPAALTSKSSLWSESRSHLSVTQSTRSAHAHWAFLGLL